MDDPRQPAVHGVLRRVSAAHRHQRRAAAAAHAFLNNLCLSLALLLILLTIAGNLKAASLIWLGFCAAFGLLDALVFQFRGNQILLSDVLSIGTALSVAGNYKPVLETPMLMLAATGAAALVLTARTRFLPRAFGGSVHG